MTIRLLLQGQNIPEENNPFKYPPIPTSLVYFHRINEQQYRDLPWPSEISNISLYTEVVGGKGDIAAATKMIQIIQKISPNSLINWFLTDGFNTIASQFLHSYNSSNVTIYHPYSRESKETIETQFLITGPVKCRKDIEYLERIFNFKLKGPSFSFLENAESNHTSLLNFQAIKLAKTNSEAEAYQEIHRLFFKSDIPSDRSDWGLSMGLKLGSGIFLDESRIQAPLSLKYCCPSYLSEMEDSDLKNDILEALGIEDGIPIHYNKTSLNSGYAHRSDSWAKFIDLVCIHEKEKNVLILLNQQGEFEALQSEEFCHQIFTEDRIQRLEKMGYGTIKVKGREKIHFSPSSNLEGQRSLTIIVRPFFHPLDMKRLQLASERLLATGDNTAAESFAARCSLYLYEDVKNGGCKTAFLQQQIEVANTISSDLGTLLSLFGTTNQFNEEQLNQASKILDNPSLKEQTFAFCQLVVENYSFRKVAEAALKRTAWHQVMPDLFDQEIESLDPSFKQGVVNFLKDETFQDAVLEIGNLQIFQTKIGDLIESKTNPRKKRNTNVSI
jgi:hypothetical protein